MIIIVVRLATLIITNDRGFASTLQAPFGIKDSAVWNVVSRPALTPLGLESLFHRPLLLQHPSCQQHRSPNMDLPGGPSALPRMMSENDDGHDGWELVDKAPALPHDQVLQPTVLEGMKCGMSRQVMEDPASVVPCGHTFDFSCLGQHQRNQTGGDRCPKCGVRIEHVMRLPDIRRLIQDTVWTGCTAAGCSVSMKVGDLEGHLLSGCTHAR